MGLQLTKNRMNPQLFESTGTEHAILPRPLHCKTGSGYLTLTPTSGITWSGNGAEAIAELLGDYLRPATGFAFTVKHSEGNSGGIHLHSDGNPASDAAGFRAENYWIEVDHAGVRLDAATPSGLARAIQTLRQLLPPEIFSSNVVAADWRLPFVEIEDAPRFRWRGLHLDVVRHFFSVEDVCQYIDLLALHRFNVCQLHLTDDQGWRVEIDQYPKLTEVGAWRKQTLIGREAARPRIYDGTPYGGFYTKDDLRKIVRFAERRGVTVIPEIDMPGHMQAAIAAYPELGCNASAEGVRCHWGISQNLLNVEPSTLRFFQNVLDEVMEIFPSIFIHIGGDEAHKREWTDNEQVQNRMRELGLHSEAELQSWFIGEMSAYLRSKGRRLIGWDEINEGGIPAGAAVMSWQGQEGALTAGKAGHDFVLASVEALYFDHYQDEPVAEEPLGFDGTISTALVYAFDPVPHGLPDSKRHHMLGAQGQLWTEYVKTVEHAHYMVYPRACALAETVWLPENEKSYRRFIADLAVHRRRLDQYKIKPHPRP